VSEVPDFGIRSLMCEGKTCARPTGRAHCGFKGEVYQKGSLHVGPQGHFGKDRDDTTILPACRQAGIPDRVGDDRGEGILKQVQDDKVKNVDIRVNIW